MDVKDTTVATDMKDTKDTSLTELKDVIWLQTRDGEF